MIVNVVSGPCGAGKSRLIAQRFKDLPVFDRATYSKAGSRHSDTNSLLREWLGKLAADGQSEVVVEGVYAPGSTSMADLQSTCSRLGFELHTVVVLRPLQVCAESILASEDTLEDKAARLKILGATYASFKQLYPSHICPCCGANLDAGPCPVCKTEET